MSLRVSLLGTMSVSTPAGTGDDRRGTAADLARRARSGRTEVCFRRASDRPVVGRHADREPGQRPPGPGVEPSSSSRKRHLVTRGSNGYSLRVEPPDVDALRLEQLLRRGREALAGGDQHRAAVHLEEAVSLVRGPPLAELAARGLVSDATSWLEGLVLDAQEARIDALLATSRHVEVVEQLRSLVIEHPLRERFHAQLMLALYRCGRQSEALAVYRHVRDLLLEDLGLDPGPELQSLERAVLCHDAALAAPAPLKQASSDTAPPVPLTSFVGRQTELGDLQVSIGVSSPRDGGRHGGRG